MVWANFLHFYQPPTQKESWIKKITQESYRKIFAQLLDFGKAKLTLNVNGVLLEHWDRCGEHDVLAMFKKLVERGQVELTGSAKYHPLLPFLPEKEVIRQIELNVRTHQKYLGGLYKPQGFFPPEMGFDVKTAKIVAKLGYRWIIADELSFPQGPQGPAKIDYSKIYEIAGIDNFNIFFRERRMSWIILSGQMGTGNLLVESLGERLSKNEYLLTAMDGETFGHHRPGLEQLLFEIYKNPRLVTVGISELPKLFTSREAITPTPSTWALMEKDLEKKEPFSRWNDPKNAIHQYQWRLTELALKYGRYPQLDRALHSDQYWWASARPWWSVEMIERGAKDLLKAIANPRVKKQAEKLYQKIVYTALDWQREGKVEEMAHREDEDIRQRTDSAIPRLPKEEIDKMVANLEKEMNMLAGKLEFERATQIRDRIRELQKYADESSGLKPSLEGNYEPHS